MLIYCGVCRESHSVINSGGGVVVAANRKMHPLKTVSLGLLFLLHAPLSTQAMVLDGIGVGPAVTVTGWGGPASSSVELFRNGFSAGSVTTTAYGQFSFPNVSAALGDSFQVAVGQIWNFSANGNAEQWGGNPGDTTLVSGGTLKFSETANGSDMGFTLFGDNLIKTKVRALEVRMRFQGAGSHACSVILRTAGPNGVQNGGGVDDTALTIANVVTLQNSANFQTYVFDLGTDQAGAATNWSDPYLPISISFNVPGTNTGDILEVDSIRLTESLCWEFNDSNDFAEWVPHANTTLSNTGNGLLKMDAAGSGAVAMSGPFRNIGSTYFTQLETRFRQVTPTQPNLFQWSYFSNPASYSGGGFQVSVPADGNFQTLNLDLAASPTYGNTWGLGGAATLNSAQGFYQAFYASAAGQFAEVDYIRLHPAVRYGTSAPVLASGAPVAQSYYVSFSGGNDANSGRSAAAPWKTFANLNSLTLGAGTTVYLKRGDTWANSKLSLAGKGVSGNPITLTAYGEGNRPRITGINLTTEPCIVWNNASYVNIDSMDCRDAKVGLYLRYAGGNTDGTGAMYNNSGVHITHCHFKNMDAPWSDVSGVITVPSPFELSWGAGIWVGGSIPAPLGGPWPSESTPILDDLSVTHCGFEQVSTGVGMNFYFPTVYKGRFTNFRFEDSWVTGCENGSMALFFVNGGHAQRVDTWLGGSGFYATGTTAGFIQHMQNFTIDDCQFAYNKQNATGNDGTGFDYEGNTTNVAFTNNVVHDNDGSGILLIDSISGNTGFNMSGNTIWNNCRHPKESGQNNEMRASTNNSGIYSNNGIYRGAANAFGTPAIYNNSSRWSPFTGYNTNRIGADFSAVSDRPKAWGFTSSVESWGNANQWTGFSSNAGLLVGNSSGTDPFAESPATWANTRERRWVYVRMSQTAGSTAQIFFQTETSQTFTADKSVTFPIIADGAMRDYVVPMGQCASYKGVVTKWRLDPTDASGSVMAIDRFDSMFQPYLMTVTPVASNIIDVKFNQAMHPDGGVFNPANYTLSGLGQGTAAANPSSVTFIPASDEPIYRLTWSSGHTNGLGAYVTASNSLDARGNALWTATPSAVDTLPQPIIDSDLDGMPDAWETAAGLSPNSNADAALDKDGDGQSNLAEYLADTNPSDPQSCFRVKRLESPGNPALIRIVWASRPGIIYHVETSDSLLAGSWVATNADPIIASSAETFWDAPVSGARCFYRVRSVRPNPMLVAH